jgi:hypothetical protein
MEQCEFGFSEELYKVLKVVIHDRYDGVEQAIDAKLSDSYYKQLVKDYINQGMTQEESYDMATLTCFMKELKENQEVYNLF